MADCIRRYAALPVEIDAPLYVISEVAENGGKTYVHLLNFKTGGGRGRAANNTPAERVSLKCCGAKEAVLYDADRELEIILTPDAGGYYHIDGLTVYGVVAFI
jgi:hypothetical protein